MSRDTLTLHASAVAVGTAGLLIVGPSGSGKSALALGLMALGATLVSDDRTLLTRPDDGPPVASAPESLQGLIEARGIGLLKAPTRARVRLHAIVDLELEEVDRLPPLRTRNLLGHDLRLFHKVGSAHFTPALMLYLKSETEAP